MDLLRLLPKATPVLLRHIGAYVELAAQDLVLAQRQLESKLIATTLLLVSVCFAVIMACLGVIASTWDTPYRVISIVWMAGGFALLALIAGLYRSRTLRAESPLFADVKREWHQDRLALDRIRSNPVD
jgi:uncharacterized membrane protein YqjE